MSSYNLNIESIKFPNSLPFSKFLETTPFHPQLRTYFMKTKAFRNVYKTCTPVPVFKRARSTQAPSNRVTHVKRWSYYHRRFFHSDIGSMWLGLKDLKHLYPAGDCEWSENGLDDFHFDSARSGTDATSGFTCTDILAFDFLYIQSCYCFRILFLFIFAY